MDMKCSVCDMRSMRLLDIRVTESPMWLANGTYRSSKETTQKGICMECFMRLAGLAAVYDITKLPEEWR